MNPFVTLLAEGDPTGTGVSQIITDAASSLKTEAGTVIAAAIGLGVVFWGARVLWGKFKGMAK